MRDRIARSIYWLVWSRGGLQLLSFLSTALMARLLGPDDYGTMALVAVWTTTLAMLVDMGLGAAVMQFPNLDKKELNLCFWITMTLALFGYLGLFLLAPLIADWFHNPRLSDVLRVAGLVLPISAARVVPDGLLKKRLELDRVSKAEIAGALASIPVMVTLAWRGFGVWALVVGMVFQPAVTNALIFRAQHWMPGLQINHARLGEILRFSTANVGARISWVLYDQIDFFILGKYGNTSSLGLYALGKQLALLPVLKISVVVNQLAFPLMAGFQNDRAAMLASFLRGLRLVACLTLPVCVGMALVAHDLVPIVLSEKWLDTVPLVQVLCFYAMIHSLAVLLPPVLFARYRAQVVLWWTLALILVMPLGFLAGALARGAVGVAWAWVFLYPFFLVWLGHQTFKELAIDWLVCWKQVQPLVGPLLAMVAAVVLVQAVQHGSGFMDRLVRLGSAVVVGGSTYAASLFWRRAPVVSEMLQVGAWILGKNPALTAPP